MKALRGGRLHRHIALVAADLFYRDGVNMVGVDRIAGKAGVTKRTLYHHYSSKDELIAEALRVSPILIFPEEGPPLERIYGAFDAVITYMTNTSFRGCPYNLFTAELPSRAHPARALIERRVAKRRAWFEARLTEAGERDAAMLAEELDTILDGALTSAMKRCTLDAVDAAKRSVRRVLASARLDATEFGRRRSE